jgi:ubiquinone/menaquinone biosynthesis C-methylase UbiE
MSTIAGDNKALDAKRFLQYEKSVIKSDRLKNVLELINSDNLKVLDVGGASGLFLSELSKQSKFRIDSYNLEVDDFFKDKQAGPAINFIRGSILDNKLDAESFDIVTFGDVLHHLIGKNLNETIENQFAAVKEIFRITKKGGFAVFCEEVNNIRIFSKIIYYLSKMANKLKLKCQFFDAGKVVIFFPAQIDIAKMIDKASINYPVIVEKEHFNRWNLSLRWKMTLLMTNVGHINYVLRKINNPTITK